MHKQIKQVLMCRPDYFDIRYKINPWMKIGSISKDKAIEQWSNLVQTYENLGIEVSIIEPAEDCPDIVFATDQGIYKDKNFILSNFRYKERQAECEFYKKYLEETGYTIKSLKKDFFFEGGDCVMFGERLLLGYGYRSDKQSAKEISKKLNIEVVSIKLTNDRFYHLDTALFALNSKTIFYVPAAFEKQEINKLSSIAEIIPIDEHESIQFAANSIVTNGHVIMTPNNPKMKDVIEKFGYKVIEVDISEFIKSGGGIHCLTLVLK